MTVRSATFSIILSKVALQSLQKLTANTPQFMILIPAFAHGQVGFLYPNNKEYVSLLVTSTPGGFLL